MEFSTSVIQQLSCLNEFALQQATELAARNEKKSLALLLLHLCEMDRRGVYLDRGFSSLYDYIQNGLGFSSTSSYRRGRVVRMLREFPEVADQIAEGTLSFCAAFELAQQFENNRRASQVSTQKKSERIEKYSSSKKPTKNPAKKPAAAPLTREQKESLLQEAQGMSLQQVRRKLVEEVPGAAPLKSVGSRKTLSKGRTEVSITFTEEQLQQWDRLKECLTRQLPQNDDATMLFFLMAEGIQKHDPLVKAERIEKKEQARQEARAARASAPTSAATHDAPPSFFTNVKNVKNTKRPRYIYSRERRKTVLRDQCGCQFIDEVTGRRCNRRAVLDFDHRHVPFRAGGANTADNLQLLCSRHNQRKEQRAKS